MNMVSGRYLGHVLFAVSMFIRLESIAFVRSRNFGGHSSRSSISRKSALGASVISIRGGSSNTEQMNSTLLCSPEKLQADSLALYEKLRGCNDAYMSKQLNSALDILSDALRLYGAEQLFASYNGGKDAVVVLHLLRAVAAKHTAETGVTCSPEFIYFAVKDEFPEVLEHIEETEKLYALNLRKYENGISQVRNVTNDQILRLL
jgi:Phosphoadenosine phosphosulfate reductase family